MFRNHLQTVLFILSPLEVLYPFPVPSSATILRTAKAVPVTFCRQFFAPGGGGGGSTLVRSSFSNFCPLYVGFFNFLSAQGPILKLFFHAVGYNFSFFCSSAIKMRYRSRVSKLSSQGSFLTAVHVTACLALILSYHLNSD